MGSLNKDKRDNRLTKKIKEIENFFFEIFKQNNRRKK